PKAQKKAETPLSTLGGRRWKDTARVYPGRTMPGKGRAPRGAPIKLAEPVSLSSTPPTNFRLPPTAARLGFDLLAPRARRKRDSRDADLSLQDLSKRDVRNLQKVQFSTFSTPKLPICGQVWG